MGEVREVAEGGADMVEGTQGSKNIFVKSAVVHGCLLIATSRKFFQISSPRSPVYAGRRRAGAGVRLQEEGEIAGPE